MHQSKRRYRGTLEGNYILKGGAAALKRSKMVKVTIRELNYIPTFKGRHNSIRCKVWLILYDRYLGGNSGLKLNELVKSTGCNYKSLSVLVGRWIRWRYIGYNNYPGGREYHILKRGKDWIERWKNVMPLERYIKEIEVHQAEFQKKGEQTWDAEE